jgi:hypothetical protein
MVRASVPVRARSDILSRLGLTVGDVPTDGAERFAWVQRARPPILTFADWLALRMSEITIFGESPRLGAGLARWTPARATTDDERTLYAALTSDEPPPPLPAFCRGSSRRRMRATTSPARRSFARRSSA